jgi:hypothetical protein
VGGSEGGGGGGGERVEANNNDDNIIALAPPSPKKQQSNYDRDTGGTKTANEKLTVGGKRRGRGEERDEASEEARR